MVYQRGKGIWWYRFRFNGIQIRQTTKSTNKGVAERLEREHHRKLELGQQGLEEISSKPLLFKVAAPAYIEETKIHWTKATLAMHKNSMKSLLPFFGKMSLQEITAAHISKYQRERKDSDVENSTVNRALATLRQVLIKHKLWSKIRDEVRMLRENQDVGKALTIDEFAKLLECGKTSNNPALYPAMLVSIHTGLRSKELRTLKWSQIDFNEAKITVGKSKSEAGTGRDVYLSAQALDILKDRKAQFPKATQAHYVFPRIAVGAVVGGFGCYRTNLDKPMGKFDSTWKRAKEQAGVECRWHDLRHTAVSLVGKGGASEATMMAMFGWMSRKMIQKYSHAAIQDKRAAVTVFDRMAGPSLPAGQEMRLEAQAGQDAAL